MNQSTTLVADQPDFWITEVEEESEEIDYYSEDDIIQSMNGYNVENESSSNDDNMNTGSSTFNHTKFTKYTLQKHLKLREYNPKIASLLPKCLIPNKTTKTLVDYSHRAYSGQFSKDGNFFFSCTQDLKVHIYDSSQPTNFVLKKEFTADYGRWTVTDCTLTENNKYLCFSSISPRLFLAKIDTEEYEKDTPIPLQLAPLNEDDFGVWSVRFSGDGREIVAGTSNNSVYVYDIETQKVLHEVDAHEDDVNAVCFADATSSHVFYSGSDDGLIKVWDRRSLKGNTSVGGFVGHTEGITFVDTKGDGRYCLSNSKDQSMKLWDIRKLVNLEETKYQRNFRTGFDYRYQRYPATQSRSHPSDSSITTYKGHAVLRTLIRCYFSPSYSTSQNYVYTGSADEHFYVYDIDGNLLVRCNAKATNYVEDGYANYENTVRDVSWHPYQPLMVSSHWTPHPAGSLVLHELKF